jgi:hypothetical protein
MPSPVVELGGVLGLPHLFLPAGRYTGCRTAVRSAVVLALGPASAVTSASISLASTFQVDGG